MGGCYETLGLEAPDLDKLEAMFPLLPYNASGKQKGSQRRSSRIRERRDSFGSRRDSRSSQPPSFTKNSGKEDSKGSPGPDGRGSRKLRRSSTGMLNVPGSKRRDSCGVDASKAKEPPPGRGYERRKARIAAAAAAAAAEEAG